MVKREFIVERQGRSFVLYAGLLDLAHSQGLRAIRTRLIQVPADENALTAIVSAEVETDRGTFSGIGDANPANVSRAMLSCTIRLAETRAKARALRDAVNVGVTAIEELGEAEDLPTPLVGHRPVAAPFAPQPTNPFVDEGTAMPASLRPIPTAPATPAQIRAIYSIARDQSNLGESEVNEKATAMFGSAPVDLSRKQASEFITSLKAHERVV